MEAETIQYPKKKKWYNAILKREGEQLSITVKAGLVSKTVYWTKP